MKCYIVRDMLSNYIDGLNSEETNIEIKKHLDECVDCRTIYEKMSTAIPQEVSPEDKNIDFLKKLKAKMLRKNVIVAVLTCIILLGGFFAFATNYEIPLPFDPNRMFVEVFTAGVKTDEDGNVLWRDLDWDRVRYQTDENGHIVWKDLEGDRVTYQANENGNILWKNMDLENGNILWKNMDSPTSYYDKIIELVRITHISISKITELSRGRNINRNGEDIWVVYYCYTKTLWDSLFFDADLVEYSESGSGYGGDIYGDSYQSMDYEPQMREIYYLPIRNLYKIENLSDEEFDAQREKATLVWKGII